MTAITDLLTPAAVQTLGWTLLHFLWQGTAVALVVAALLWLTRRSSPTLRYGLACAGLALMVLLPTVTYAVLIRSANAVPDLAYDLVAPSAPSSQTDETTTRPASELSPAEAAPLNRLEPYLPYLVAVWFLGVVVLTVRLIGGLWLLRKLKKRFNEPVSETLAIRCRELAQRLGVTRVVQLRESLSVNVPLVIGWLRPLILLPTSAMSGLSVGQLELILAHELAHIRRHDYLVNLLQNLTVPQTPNPTQWTAGLVLILVPLLSVSCRRGNVGPTCWAPTRPKPLLWRNSNGRALRRLLRAKVPARG